MFRSRASLATALLVLALAGCDADTDNRSATGGGPSVIVPGAPGDEGQRIADIRECHLAFDVVISVGATAVHAQRKILLGGRRLGARGRHGARA